MSRRHSPVGKGRGRNNTTNVVVIIDEFYPIKINGKLVSSRQQYVTNRTEYFNPDDPEDGTNFLNMVVYSSNIDIEMFSDIEFQTAVSISIDVVNDFNFGHIFAPFKNLKAISIHNIKTLPISSLLDVDDHSLATLQITHPGGISIPDDFNKIFDKMIPSIPSPESLYADMVSRIIFNGKINDISRNAFKNIDIVQLDFDKCTFVNDVDWSVFGSSKIRRLSLRNTNITSIDMTYLTGVDRIIIDRTRLSDDELIKLYPYRSKFGTRAFEKIEHLISIEYGDKHRSWDDWCTHPVRNRDLSQFRHFAQKIPNFNLDRTIDEMCNDINSRYESIKNSGDEEICKELHPNNDWETPNILILEQNGHKFCFSREELRNNTLTENPYNRQPWSSHELSLINDFLNNPLLMYTQEETYTRKSAEQILNGYAMTISNIYQTRLSNNYITPNIVLTQTRVPDNRDEASAMFMDKFVLDDDDADDILNYPPEQQQLKFLQIIVKKLENDDEYLGEILNVFDPPERIILEPSEQRTHDSNGDGNLSPEQARQRFDELTKKISETRDPAEVRKLFVERSRIKRYLNDDESE
jgi:hypothetical protein